MLCMDVLAFFVGKDIHLVIVLVAGLKSTKQRPHPIHSPLAASFRKQFFIVQPCIFSFALHVSKVLVDFFVSLGNFCPLRAYLLCIFDEL